LCQTGVVPLGAIAENVNVIRDRLSAAAERSGRSGAEIRLVAVTKTQPLEAIREALAAGIREFGENYVQEAEAKLAHLDPASATRHFIGHLQKNKAGKAAALFDVVQAVDSV
jgi:PLP dependent protein